MIEMETDINRSIALDGEHLTLEQVLSVARNMAPVKLHISGKEKLLKSRKIVERIISRGEVAYGITTGFGKFSDLFPFFSAAGGYRRLKGTKETLCYSNMISDCPLMGRPAQL
jgi:hypothetical protein